MTGRRHLPALGSARVRQLDEDRRREHASRLLLSGWSVEAAAELSGLAVDQLLEIAAKAGEIGPTSDAG